MEWVKKNLGFVIALGVAVVLVGVGVFYLLGTKGEADAVAADLQAKNDQLDGLLQRPVFPDQGNIQAAQDQEARVGEFVKGARKHFSEVPKPEGLDTASFKSHLETTIAELAREAERAGVKLPDKGSNPSYGFTFDEQRKQLQLPANSLAPLAVQLQDLQEICRVLFDAKVPSVVSLKRAAVGTNESSTSGAFLAKKITTNSAIGSVSYPYEVVFQGFSPELAAVMTGFVESKEAFVIKSVNVERGNLETTSQTAATPMTPAPGASPYGMSPDLARRYGIGPRFGGQPGVPQAPPPTTSRPGEVVLDEKPLRVTLGLELIKLIPPEAPAPARGAQPAARVD